jgi:hypothetical protein
VPQIARRGCGWLMNSTRGMKGKYGLKDKNEMVGGRRIYGQKRGIIALAHGDGVEERDNTNVSWHTIVYQLCMTTLTKRHSLTTTHLP